MTSKKIKFRVRKPGKISGNFGFVSQISERQEISERQYFSRKNVGGGFSIVKWPRSRGGAQSARRSWPARRHRTCPPLLACGHELGFGTRSHRQCGGSECVASRPAAGHHCSGRRSSGVHPRQDSVRPA